jgi:hypothetical protein
LSFNLLMINRRWPLENIFRLWITSVSYHDGCETFHGRSMDSWVHTGVKRVCFILRTDSPGGRQPYFSPDFNAQPTFTNLFIDYWSLFKLITIKLKSKIKKGVRLRSVTSRSSHGWELTPTHDRSSLSMDPSCLKEEDGTTGGRRWPLWSLIVNPVGIVDHRPFLVNKTPPYHFSDGQKIYRSTQTNHSSP